ncbi:unnamed protein product [Candidula unifasciata]|uniref:Uncharacterized protein n=1 Tax=Candidula unifasciata TaxID=100452 RepID=A0A8S3YP64_9EUPU|nr:unnamed protein product [Candidula unifasciata]
MWHDDSVHATSGEENEESLQSRLHSQVQSSLIQIKAASEDEVSRRIQAFIRNKRNEVDERNIREFISPFSSEPGTSCARVEAVYVHREGQKSHITLKRVENASGPQTQIPADNDDGRSLLSYRVPVDVQRADAVEERLYNLETHLNIKSDAPEIYARIKALEERVSYLEGLSPEYFTDGIPQKIKKLEPGAGNEGIIKNIKLLPSQDESLTDIDIKIRQLKQALREKQKPTQS